MEEDKGKKKYRYSYYTATGKEEIEVDEKWYEILRQADRDMYNNNRREEYKSYHLNSYVDDDSGEENDAWETVADKETVQLESDICATMDENWVLDCLSKRNKYIYEKCGVEGVSQSVVAKELGLTQSSVSRRLKKILYAMEWQRLKDGRSKREIKEELDFRQMERANDTELGESVLVDYFLGSILEEQDLINFIGWFYSAKELKRYAGRRMLKSAIGNQNSRYCPTIDHIRPLSKGGQDVLENIVICNQKTNEEKADTFPVWYANERRFQARKVKGTSNEYDIYQID